MLVSVILTKKIKIYNPAIKISRQSICFLNKYRNVYLRNNNSIYMLHIFEYVLRMQISKEIY